jgi:hypothetical protein
MRKNDKALCYLMMGQSSIFITASDGVLAAIIRQSISHYYHLLLVNTDFNQVVSFFLHHQLSSEQM